MLVLTTAASRALDSAAQERYGIPGIVLMENAAVRMAAVAHGMLPRDRAAPRVVIVCGPGNNGGDGYAVARQLANRGARVSLVPVGVPRPGSDAAIQASICQAMGLPIASLDVVRQCGDDRPDLIIDAIFGTGLDRPVTGAAAEAIEAITDAGGQGTPILALDLPSGLDGDSGLPLGTAVRATATAVTVAPRPAMAKLEASPYIGRFEVVDIGAPRTLLAEFGTTVAPPAAH